MMPLDVHALRTKVAVFVQLWRRAQVAPDPYPAFTHAASIAKLAAGPWRGVA